MRSSMRVYTSSERVSQFLSPLHADSQTFFMFKFCASPISQVFLVFVNCIVFNNIIRHHAFLPISFPIFLRFRTISIQMFIIIFVFVQVAQTKTSCYCPLDQLRGVYPKESQTLFSQTKLVVSANCIIYLIAWCAVEVVFYIVFCHY